MADTPRNERWWKKLTTLTLSERITALKDANDDAWKAAVKKRDRVCAMCDKTEKLHPHHWFIRKARSLAMRWDMRNGVALCFYCHLKQVHMFSDYLFMEAFFNVMKFRWGKEMGAMRRIAEKSWRPTEDWLLGNLNILEGLL